jgi:CheY-like chemotaxis protein
MSADEMGMSAKNSILVVEGSRTQAERLKLVLQAYDYPVLVVTDGGEAIEVARAQRPALIVSGVALAGMDGYDMCAALKQDGELRHIPVALLTALTDVDDLMRGLKAKVDYYIAKPYQEEDLLARISAIIAGQVQWIEHSSQKQLGVWIRGEQKTVNPDQQQLMRLLLSTYENYNAMLRQNRALSTAQLQLKTQNQHLQGECERLQAAVKKLTEKTTSSASPLVTPDVQQGTTHDARVLVAEDTAICRTLFARLLEKLGRQAELVSNGLEAVEATRKRQYAAILMDIQMPIMGGFEATAQIRQHEKASGGHIPIIAVTAHTQPGDQERCLAAGMDEYLPKPVTLEMLQHVLERRVAQSPLLTSVRPREETQSAVRAEKVR